MKKSEIYQLAIIACINGLMAESDADAFEVFDELFSQLNEARKAESAKETADADTDINRNPVPGPCPECGRKELAVRHCAEGFRVCCTHCGLAGRKLQATVKDAIETWNWHEGGGQR